MWRQEAPSPSLVISLKTELIDRAPKLNRCAFAHATQSSSVWSSASHAPLGDEDVQHDVDSVRIPFTGRRARSAIESCSGRGRPRLAEPGRAALQKAAVRVLSV